MASPETEFRYAPFDVVGAYSILGQFTSTEGVELYHGVHDRTLDEVMIKVGKTPASDEVLRHEAAVHSRFSSHLNVVSLEGFGDIDNNFYIATSLQPKGTLVNEITESRQAVITTSPLDTALHELADELKAVDTSSSSPILDGSYVERVKDALIKGPATERIHVLEEQKEVHASDILEVAVEVAAQAGVDAKVDSLEVKMAAYDWANRLAEEEAEIDPDSLPDRETVLRRASILAGVARAVEVMHSFGVVHRDIKPANMAVTSLEAGALLDFGIATTDHKKRDLAAGTVGYMSTESMKGYVSPKGDYFSLAATAYEALTSVRPWEKLNELSIDNRYDRVKDVVPIHPSELNPNVTRHLGNTIMKGLSPYPDSRATAGQMLHALRHAHVGVNSTI